MIVSLILLLIPFAIVGSWTKRPVIALVIATVLAFLFLVTPVLIQVFQDLIIYDSSDPQLMAGFISRALVNSTLTMFIVFPLLLIFQIFMRRRRKKKMKHEARLSDFD